MWLLVATQLQDEMYQESLYCSLREPADNYQRAVELRV